LKNSILKQEEQRDIIQRRLELLNIENGDLQNTIQTLENKIQSMQVERDALQDNLRETREICSQLESTLSCLKHGESSYKQQIDDLRLQLNQAETFSAEFASASAEKDESMRNLVTGLQSQLSGSRSQLEQLSNKNNDLQNVIQSLENSLQSTKEERDSLHASLGETREVCSKLESMLSTFKEANYERRVDELQNQLNETETALATAKEQAMQDSAQTELTLQKVVAGHQSHISDLTSQISKLIDQLSTLSGEKAIVGAKVESVTMELSTMKFKAEAQANKISQLESTIVSLTQQRDTADMLSPHLSSPLPSGKNTIASFLNDKETETEVVGQSLMRAGTVESDRDASIEDHQSEINELISVNTEFAKANSTLESRTTTDSIERKEAIEALTTHLTDLKRDHTIEVQKLSAELRELRGNSAALEEAIEGDFAKHNMIYAIPSMLYSNFSSLI
jgi:chromosome segregation ATPase